MVGLHQVEEDRTQDRRLGAPVCPARSLAGPARSDAHASTLPPGRKPNQQFKNRKIQFMKALSENLYFRNLDNDAGVFHYLLDAAEEEEVKEEVLAYHFLRTAARPLTAAELDRRIADWFTRRWEAAFDFEVDDGVGKLRRLRLVDDDGQGRLTAVTLDEAKRRLDQIWDNLFAYHAPPRPGEA